MTALERPDYPARTPEALATIFEYFGELECPQVGGHLYGALCRGIAGDDELLAMAALAPTSQPPPNLLFGAVHYLLLGGEADPLREWYPNLARHGGRTPESAFPAFREFCVQHRQRIGGLIETRLTQTNIVRRCSALLPAFARVSDSCGGQPLALIEIGASAGLNLQWDRFRYSYDDRHVWGDRDASVHVECALRGSNPLPPLPDVIPVAWRRGIDLNPIDIADPDAVQWLRALIWPEHVERHERLANAIGVAHKNSPTVVAGDAAEKLTEQIAAAPSDARVCVYGTHTLYQFPPDALRTTLRSMQIASREREVDFSTIEGTGDGCSELKQFAYRGGEREMTLAARCNPHGHWLEWLV